MCIDVDDTNVVINLTLTYLNDYSYYVAQELY